MFASAFIVIRFQARPGEVAHTGRVRPWCEKKNGFPLPVGYVLGCLLVVCFSLDSKLTPTPKVPGSRCDRDADAAGTRPLIAFVNPIGQANTAMLLFYRRKAPRVRKRKAPRIFRDLRERAMRWARSDWGTTGELSSFRECCPAASWMSSLLQR